MCMRENRSHGPKMKLHARIFVSQPLCCAIPVPYMLPLFFVVLHPQPFYPGLGHSYLLIVPHFFRLFDFCVGIHCSSTVRALHAVKEKWLNPNLGCALSRYLGVWDASQPCPVPGAPRKHRLGLNWISYPFQTQESSHNVLKWHILSCLRSISGVRAASR